MWIEVCEVPTSWYTVLYMVPEKKANGTEITKLHAKTVNIQILKYKYLYILFPYTSNHQTT